MVPGAPGLTYHSLASHMVLISIDIVVDSADSIAPTQCNTWRIRLQIFVHQVKYVSKPLRIVS